MTDSIDHITFLNNDNPPILEDLHPIFQQVKITNPNKDIKKELTKFVSYTFNESIFSGFLNSGLTIVDASLTMKH